MLSTLPKILVKVGKNVVCKNTLAKCGAPETQALYLIHGYGVVWQDVDLSLESRTIKWL